MRKLSLSIRWEQHPSDEVPVGRVPPGSENRANAWGLHGNVGDLVGSAGRNSRGKASRPTSEPGSQKRLLMLGERTRATESNTKRRR